jgi:hypothetical protein
MLQGWLEAGVVDISSYRGAVAQCRPGPVENPRRGKNAASASSQDPLAFDPRPKRRMRLQDVGQCAARFPRRP